MAESDWVTDVNPGYRTKTIKVGNVTCEINRPILTEAERKKAEARFIQTLMTYGKQIQ